MKVLIVTKEAQAKIDEINTQFTDKCLVPDTLKDGRSFLCPDLLGDCGDGQTWEAYADVLWGLKVEEV